MYVKKIDWLDEVSKEAIVEVAEGIERLVLLPCHFHTSRDVKMTLLEVS